MGNRNKNAGREPAATRPARRTSITSPTELAVHLGRQLSASAVDGNGWTDLHCAAALDWLAMARGASGGRGAGGPAAADRRRARRPGC